MSDWKPPKFGSPVWMGISATDVSRAHKFYSAVFNWKFKDASDGHPESKIRLFDFNPDVFLTGGITVAPEPTGTLKPGHGGVCLYWLVESLDKSAKLVEVAGGKMLSGPEKEGESGVYRYFEDTEGNIGALHMMLG